MPDHADGPTDAAPAPAVEGVQRAGDADLRGDSGGEAGAAPGAGEDRISPKSAELSQDAAADDSGEDQAAAEHAVGTEAQERDASGPLLTATKDQKVKKKSWGRRSDYSLFEFTRVLKACEGNLRMTARVLGLDIASVRERVQRTPHLYALYGQQAHDAPLPTAPTDGGTMLRSPKDLPLAIPSADLGQMVQVTEKLLAGGGLAKLGVPAATIAKLRDLSELRIDAGAMLAVSLQDTHQLYYLQLLTLQARADEIRKRYLSEGEEGCAATLVPLERMFWQRAHTEIVEQLGKGYDRMMAGTQAMVAMMKGGREKSAGTANQSEAGWSQQVPKSVNRALKNAQG